MQVVSQAMSLISLQDKFYASLDDDSEDDDDDDEDRVDEADTTKLYRYEVRENIQQLCLEIYLTINFYLSHYLI